MRGAFEAALKDASINEAHPDQLGWVPVHAKTYILPVSLAASGAFAGHLPSGQGAALHSLMA